MSDYTLSPIERGGRNLVNSFFNKKIAKYWGTETSNSLEKKVYKLCIKTVTENETLDENDANLKVPQDYTFLHFYLIEIPPGLESEK